MNSEGRFITISELLSEGRMSAQGVPEKWRNSYDEKIVVGCIEDAVVTPWGVYIPDRDRFVLESSLAGCLQHTDTTARQRFLSDAGVLPPAAGMEIAVPSSEPKIDTAMWACYPWDKNYQHFIIETLPRLFLLTHFAHSFNNDPTTFLFNREWIRDIASHVGVRLEKSVAVDFGSGVEQRNVRCRRLFLSSVVNVNMLNLNNKILSNLTSRLRRRFWEGGREPGGRCVYLGRRPDKRNTGMTRVINNEADLVQALSSQGVQPIYMEDEPISEKFYLLRDAEVVVTPVGANVMNLILAGALKHVILLQHPISYLPTKWFSRLLNGLQEVSMTEIAGVLADGAPEWIQSPYTIDVHAVIAALRS